MGATDKGLTLLNKWFFVQKVASDPKLSRCAVACAFHLVDYYNDRLGRAWPSYVTLAKLTGSNRRTVIEAVKRLIALKYFEVEKGDGRRSNYYRPNFSLMVKESARPEDGDEKATAPVAEAPPLQGVVVNFSAPNTSYIPVAPSEGDIEVSPRFAGSSALVAPSPSRGAPLGFEEFWQAYPRKEGRKAALASYEVAMKKENVTPELLALKAAQYAAAKENTNPKYIKMPRTWLEDECWLEDPQPAKAKAAKTSPKRNTGKSKGEAKYSSKARSKKPARKTKKSKTNSAPASRPKASASKTGPKRAQRCRPAPRAATRESHSRHFGEYVRLYCNYLEITPRDLALATCITPGILEGICSGEYEICKVSSWWVGDHIRSVLIEAVRHRPRDQPLTVEWLRELYNSKIDRKPPKRYEWMTPKFYEPSERDQG